MKKVFFILAVAATVVSCGTGSSTEATTTTTDSTSVKCDSTKCDTTKVSVDTTK